MMENTNNVRRHTRHFWNPWHGCQKISEGCKHCYVYRQDERYSGSTLRSSTVSKNKGSFNAPIKFNRNGSYKFTSGQIIYTCFTSDFFVEDADIWRGDAWAMIRKRKDLRFFFFTKRIDRFFDVIPPDWEDGYENVIIGCTVENQEIADYRLSIFEKLPIKRKAIIIAPMLEKMDISPYLNDKIEVVSVSGESGSEARILDYSWVLDIRRQCVEQDVSFNFHQTGAKLLKDGKIYKIHRKNQISQAKKANICYKLRKDLDEDLSQKVEVLKLF